MARRRQLESARDVTMQPAPDRDRSVRAASRYLPFQNVSLCSPRAFVYL